RGVRLLGRLGKHPHADASLLGTVLQRRTLRLADDLLPAVPHELTDGRHIHSRRKQNDKYIAWRILRSMRRFASGLKAESLAPETYLPYERCLIRGPSPAINPRRFPRKLPPVLPRDLLPVPRGSPSGISSGLGRVTDGLARALAGIPSR